MYRLIALAFALTVLPGCGAINDLLAVLTGGTTTETGSAKLLPFASEKEFVDYFSGQVQSQNESLLESRQFVDEAPVLASNGEADGSFEPSDSALPPSANLGGTDDSAATEADFSQTTIQEQGVDEPDVIKSDGTHLYIIDGGTLRIVRASPPDQLADLGTVQLEGSGRDIFLYDGKVIALTETGFFFGGGVIILSEPGIAPVTPAGEEIDSDGIDDGDASAGSVDAAVSLAEPDITAFTRPSTYVTIVDVSTPESPRILSTTSFEGTPSASRMIDGVLHMVLSNFQNFYFDVLPRLGEPDVDTDSLDPEAILPGFQRVDDSGTVSHGTVLTWREMFRPTDPDGFGVVTVVSLDVDDDAAFSAVGIVAEPGLVYSSLNAMYLTDTEFDFFRDTRETTDIYKFDYVDRGAVPVATGSVPGRILNQYSMSEFDEHLRVATTTSSVDGFGFTPGNNVYVLAQEDDELKVVGSIEDIAPGETIQSARFIGERGYLVTFETIDPFFTLNLADPTDPEVVGELKVTGFSTFILPIDKDHLLTVGRFIPDDGRFFPWGVQLSIFDVTDFAQPRLTANVVIGEETGASSEALFNPKALTYFAEQGLVALPISIFEGFLFDDIVFIDEPFVDEEPVAGDDPTDTGDSDVFAEPAEPPTDLIAPAPQGFEGVIVFSVDVDNGFTEVGRLSSRFEDAGIFFSSFTRGLFIGSNVFAVTNNGIRGGALGNLASQPFELIFE